MGAHRPKYIHSDKAEGTFASYPAMPLVQNDQKFYLATVPVKDIFPFSFVSRRDEFPVDGFQRMLSEQRAKDIATYLDGGEGSIPTNIVLSAQEDAELTYNSKTKTIKFKRTSKGFLVIDGQHRLYGYGMTTKEHRVPVAIYTGLSRQDEAALFIDINTNQKGVPSALLLDIKQLAAQESENETMLREFFDNLNKKSESPLNGLLSPSASVRGKVSRVTFNRGFAMMLNSSVMTRLPKDKKLTLAINYFKAIENNISTFPIILKSSYFEAICMLFEKIAILSYSKHKNYKLESLMHVLEPLQIIDFGQLETGGHTKIGRAQIYSYLEKIFDIGGHVTEDMV